MRVATYNIRNGRAIDPSSFWWARRRSLAAVIDRIDADIWAFQEAYDFQRRYIRRRVLAGELWSDVGDGRNGGGRGEQVPIFFRRATLSAQSDSTRWFGGSPDVPGSRQQGAAMPRIATSVELVLPDDRVVQIVNLHLDHQEAERRAASISQLVEWFIDRRTPRPTIIMGDFNGPRTEDGFDALREAGMQSALPDDAGPTSNGFGRRLDEQHQIDHVFVSSDFVVRAATVDRSAGHASDHYPVVVDLDWRE